MVWGLGLGKARTRLGRFLDVKGITQGWLESKSGLGETTLTRLCNDNNYDPTERTQLKVVGTLRKYGYDVYPHDFW